MNMSQLNQEVMPTVVGVTFLSYLAAVPPGVILGAFAGSVIFLLGSTNKPKWQWLLYFTVAFLTGLLGAQTVAEVSTGLLSFVHITSEVPQGFGAIMAAACTINTLGWLRDNPGFFWTRKQGDKA